MKQIVLVFSVIACSFALQARAQDESQRRLEPKVAAGALDAFKSALDERWSYRYANRADFDAAIAALRKRIDGGITQNELGIELQKIIALGRAQPLPHITRQSRRPLCRIPRC